MKITQRLVVLLLIVCLTLTAFIFIFLLIKRQEGKLYIQADALQRRQILSGFIDIRRNEITSLAQEISANRGVTDYLNSRKTSLAEANLQFVLAREGLDLVQVYGRRGGLIYSSASKRTLQSLKLPEPLFSGIGKAGPNYFTEPWRSQYIQIGVAPVTATGDTATLSSPRGYVVIGKLWSLDTLHELSRNLDYSVRFHTSEPVLKNGDAHFNVNLVIPLKGWNDQPVAWLQFSSSNPFITQWQSLGKQMLWIFLAFSLAFLVLQFALLLIWIRSPLKLISSSMQLGNPELIKPLIATNNEFGEVAKLIRRFFEQNQQLRNEIEERRKTESMLRQAQKMESIGTLAGGIAHDFNNIITIISGYVALAAGKARQQTEICHNLDEALLACLRAKKLIEKILTYSRQAEKNELPVKLAEVVKETVELLTHTIPASTRIRTRLTSDAYVLADPIELQQVVMNLATNAHHALGYEGGSITLEVADQPGTGLREQGLETDPDLDYVSLKVRDTGSGIPKEILARIFDPYFSTKAAGEGTGLGLSIVQGIVTSIGGLIRVNSEMDKGTEFCVYLPVTVLRPVQKKAPVPKAVFIPARLVFVDDEPALAALFKESLTEAGYQVITFTDSVAALQHISENASGCDLLIADIAMPEINGVELARRARGVNQNLPIILYSGFSDSAIIKSCRELGINRLLIKPVLPDTLAHVIREVMAEQKPALRLP